MVNKWLWLPVLLFAVLASSAVQAVPIGEVKKTYSDGASVFLRGVVTYITPTECYIQSRDRSAGIWAEADTSKLALGDEIYLTGDITIQDGERIVRRTYITKTNLNFPISPLAMANKSLGGAALGLQPGIDDYSSLRVCAGNGCTTDWQWSPGAGPNNIGLLVKTWGTVKSVYDSAVSGARWFHIDDGSRVVSDLGDSGVLVYSDAQVNIGDSVVVAGISSLEPAIDKPEKMIRVLRTRSASDVQVTKPVEASDPGFSDEFSEPVLGSMWAYNKACGSISVTSNPGWVRLICPENGDCWPCLSRVIKLNYGDTLSIRVRADFSPSATATQSVGVIFSNSPLSSTAPIQYEPVVVGLCKNPEYGSYVVVGDKMVYVPCGEVAVTVKDGNITAVLDDGAVQMIGRLQEIGPYLKIRIHSMNPNPIGRPFAAYVDYVRVTPAN